MRVHAGEPTESHPVAVIKRGRTQIRNSETAQYASVWDKNRPPNPIGNAFSLADSIYSQLLFGDSNSTPSCGTHKVVVPQRERESTKISRNKLPRQGDTKMHTCL